MSQRKERKRNPPRAASRRPQRLTAAQRKEQSQRDKARNVQRTRPMSETDSKMSTAPVAQSKSTRNNKPKMRTLPNGDCVITHREYVMDISAGSGTPTVYNVQSLPVNPGQASTFQWLSRVASNYESYVFEKLGFCYETEASTTLGGTLLLTLDYDATDAAPVSKQQAMSYRGAVRSAPWSPCEHRSLKEDLSKSKTNFIRIGAQPANTDIKTYDIGNLFVISQGIGTASATLGELYVEYTVKLMTPIFEPIPPFVPAGGRLDGTGVLSAANPLGAGTGQVQAGAVGIACDSLSNITFAQTGTYWVTFLYYGTGITADLLLAGSIHQIVGLAESVALADGTQQNSIWEVQILQPGFISLSATATTLSAVYAYIGSTPVGS